jgi:hypothetical protein
MAPEKEKESGDVEIEETSSFYVTEPNDTDTNQNENDG